jgi:hypothetical protein
VTTLRLVLRIEGDGLAVVSTFPIQNFDSNKYFINLRCTFSSNKIIDFVLEILPCPAFLHNNMLYKYIYTLIDFSNYTT